MDGWNYGELDSLQGTICFAAFSGVNEFGR